MGVEEGRLLCTIQLDILPTNNLQEMVIIQFIYEHTSQSKP